MTHTSQGRIASSVVADQSRRLKRHGSGNRAALAENLLPWGCLLGAMLLWAASLPQLEPEEIGALGLITALPWTMVPAFGLVIAGLVIALGGKSRNSLLPCALILMLVVLLHGTPAFLYENLRYAWAWKHLGVIDYIQRTGSPDPWSRYLSAYHNWPGFFLVFAGIGKLFALDPLAMSQIARFFPLGLNLLYVIVLPYIFRRLTTDFRLVWTATAMFAVGNWVGQDYFSPQGTVFLLLLIVLALCLGPLATIPPLRESSASPFLAGLERFQLWSTRDIPVPPRLPKAQKVAVTGVVWILILAIVASHQLTPLLMITMFAGLFLIGRLSISFTLFAVTAEVLWLLFIADPFVGRVLPILLSELGTIGEGTFNAVVNWSQVSDGQRLVSMASRAIVAAIAMTAAAGGLVRWHKGYRDGIAIVLVLAPLPLAIATSYGGEILFRIYFFALPFLSFFTGALLFPTQKSTLTPLKATTLGLFLMAMSAAFIIANNGKDAQYRFSAGEVAAAHWLYASAEPNTLLIEGASTYPMQFQNYENMIYVPLPEELPSIGEALASDPAGLLADWLRNHDGPAYAIFTRSQNSYFEAMNLLAGSSLANLVKELLASPDLDVAFAGPDAIVFKPAPPLDVGLSPEDIVNARLQLPRILGFGGLASTSSAFSREQIIVREEARLTAALIDAGYHDARVAIADIESEALDWPFGLTIDAGPLYHIGAIWTVLEEAPPAGLFEELSGFFLRVTGEPASRTMMESLSGDIERLLGQAGFPFAKANPGEMIFQQSSEVVSAEIRIDIGPRAVIETTRVEGFWHTVDADIVAGVTLPQDEPYTRGRIDALHDALSALTTIVAARIEVEPVGPNAVDIVVRVDPAPNAFALERDMTGILLLVTVLLIIAASESMKTVAPKRHDAAIDDRAIAAGLLAIISAAYVLLRISRMIGL